MIKYYPELIQGSNEWFEARRGTLTASEMSLIITPSNLRPASNDKEKAHLYELAAQTISGYVEPSYISDDMLRGHTDEVEARILYEKHYEPVQDMGFVTNDKWGFKIGYSPDGLVGEDGQIECKSRRQKFQLKTILSLNIPEEFIIQVQAGLLVTERQWCDFVTYCAGMPMFTKRIYPHKEIQEAIINASDVFYKKMDNAVLGYKKIIDDKNNRMIPTERKKEEEISVNG